MTLLLLHILDFQFQLVDPLLQDFLEPLDVLGGVVVGLADGHVERAFWKIKVLSQVFVLLFDPGNARLKQQRVQPDASFDFIPFLETFNENGIQVVFLLDKLLDLNNHSGEFLGAFLEPLLQLGPALAEHQQKQFLQLALQLRLPFDKRGLQGSDVHLVDSDVKIVVFKDPFQ